MPTTLERVQDMRRKYREEVKPRVEEGAYETAKGELTNIISWFKFYKELSRYHSYRLALHSVEVILEEIETKEISGGMLGMLEASLAQLELAVQSRNTLD